MRKTDSAASHRIPIGSWQEHGHQFFQNLEKGENILGVAMLVIAIAIAAAMAVRLVMI